MQKWGGLVIFVCLIGGGGGDQMYLVRWNDFLFLSPLIINFNNLFQTNDD